MDQVNILIIGAGIVGLAVAAELSRKYDDIIVLEKWDTFGQETSSRNSEVIHSGIYYPQGSLKARLCVEGALELYCLCQQYAIPCKRIGKLIVATDAEEVDTLEDLFQKGRSNEVNEIFLIDGSRARKTEPHVNAVAAIHSPGTGIIDSHSLMKHFFNEAKYRGVLFAFNSEVTMLEKEKSGFVICIKQDDYRIKSNVVINCAGLASDYIAGLAGVDIQKNDYKLKFCKGSYFSYSKPSPVSMLIYPVPHKELYGLGVHATLDLQNRLRFGPDAEYVDFIDYKVDSNKKELFYGGGVKIISGLDKDAFIADMAGVRPKLQGPGEKTRDFVITEESGKGLSGLINLIGIESPGLTASPAIAKMVADIMRALMD